MEAQLLQVGLSDVSKVSYLEVLDAAFSIDSVLGAFAFTLSVALNLLGNGLGAFVVRQLTVRNVEWIKQYVCLKNGAMDSILSLRLIMLPEGFGADVPSWLSPVTTFTVVGCFFWKSRTARRSSIPAERT
jgi:hypothetical protein